MANNITILDSISSDRIVKTTETLGVHTPHHNIDSCALPTGAATAANQTTAIGHLDGLEGLLAGGLPAALGAGGGVKVDGSGTALPVSGTFWQATQPVSLATVPSHEVTNAGTFAVQATGTLSPTTATTGGELSHSGLSTAAVYTAEVKNAVGQVYSLDMFNKGATPVYVRLYNQTGAPGAGDGANIVWRGIVPGSVTGAGFLKSWPNGKAFTTGIGIRVSGAIADNDTTVLAADEVEINIGYK